MYDNYENLVALMKTIETHKRNSWKSNQIYEYQYKSYKSLKVQINNKI